MISVVAVAYFFRPPLRTKQQTDDDIEKGERARGGHESSMTAKGGAGHKPSASTASGGSPNDDGDGDCDDDGPSISATSEAQPTPTGDSIVLTTVTTTVTLTPTPIASNIGRPHLP